MLNSQKRILQKLAKQSPETFRKFLTLPGEQQLSFNDAQQPWQLQDIQALDRAWQELAGILPFRFEAPAIRRAYIERPRGHSKTSDMALQIAWILLAARHPINGLAAAADRDQANFIHDSIVRLAAANPVLCADLAFVQHCIRNRETGSRLDVISSDVRSSFGALPDFVVCDEICHWEKPDLWYSLLSSAAKKPECVLTVLTNAGVGTGWQWELREHARNDSRWYFSSLNRPQAPWISEAWLAEQRALLPESVYERLWLNIWQHSDGTFVTLEEAEACCDPELTQQAQGVDGRLYVAAIDFAEKRDFTVGCVCHREGERVVVDRMDVVQPTPEQPTQVQWVEDWIAEIAGRFRHVQFVVDEYQLLGTIQRLEQRFPIRRFRFQGTKGNQQLALLLRQLILQRQVAWYPDCGKVASPFRDDLATELSSLLLKQTQQGQFRIDHIADGKHHDDRAFALGVACLELHERRAEQDVFIITPPSGDTFTW